MRRRASAALLVAAFAAAWAHLAWNTFIGPPRTPKYFVTHNGPAFSAPDPAARNLYLRRLLPLTERPRHAWLQVIARDRLRVYVNGELVAGGDRDGLPIAFTVDLTPHLQVGPNVIAITARQSSVDRPPEVSVAGQYSGSGGQIQTIGPDEEWRAATRHEHSWLTADFLDRHWPAATVSETALRSAVDGPPPRAVTTPSRASWVTPATDAGARVALRREFDVDDRPARAWLRLTSTAAYRVAINGLIVDEQEDAVGTDEPAVPARRTYDVTRFVRRGSNAMALLLTRTAGTPHALADIEVEGRGGSRVHVATGREWVSRTGPPADWLEREIEDAAEWRPVRVEAGDVGVPPWSVLHEHVPTPLPFAAAARRIAGQAALAIVVAVVAWFACGRAERAVGRVAYLALVPATLGIAIAVLATYDPRVAPEAVFRPLWVALAALSVPIQWLAFALPWPHLARSRPRLFGRVVSWEAAVVAGLMIAGLSLRIGGLAAEPLQWDEVEHYEYTRGFFERGFPSREIHPDLPIAYVHTSELMFVPAAIADVFFGDPRYVMRAPALVWSVLSILLVFLAGRRMFSPAVGLVAAALLALSPASITMSTVGRYFSQLQFLTLLVVYAFWLTIRGTGAVNRAALAVTAAAFAAMYLTWEGSAFLAVGLVFAVLVHRRGRLRPILADPAVWVALAGVAMVLVLQYSHVALQQTKFLWYGTSLSDLRIRPMWHYPTFRPWFYVWESSWSRDALVPMAALAGGVLLSARHGFRRPLRYLLIVYLTTCLFMASLLPAVAWRYIHHLVPLLVLLASAAFAAVARALGRFARRGTLAGRGVTYARALAAGVMVAAVATGSGIALDLRELPRFRIEGFDRSSYKYPNLEAPSRYVRDRLRPGDVVLATDPFQVKHFMGLGGRSDAPPFFWPASTLQLSATLDDRRPVPLDRRDGTPAIVDLASLRGLFARYDRIWYIVQPERHENQNLPEVSAFLRQQMDVVYEDFEAVVLLRDRNHRRAALRSEEEQALHLGNRPRTNFPPEPRLPQ